MTLVREYQPTFVLGDGETKEFSYLFEEVSENFIKVIVKHSDDSTYVPVFSVDLDSHKVVFGESETAPLNTDVVCIYRNTPDLQDTPFRTLQGYDAKALENILSKIVAMIQELKANGFSTQILQGTPWQLDLLHPDDDGASVVVDYNARILKKGLYFQLVGGNLQVSADGNNFIKMPKSADITEFRQKEVITEDLVEYVLQYRVNGVWYNAGGVGGSGLPDQTGNAGKFLTTDGTDASWGNLKITSTQVIVGTTWNVAPYTVLVGVNSYSWTTSANYGVAVGYTAACYTYSVAVGANSIASGDYSIAIGYHATAPGNNSITIGAEAHSGARNSVCIGYDAETTSNAQNAIQIGSGVNRVANTLMVANGNGNFEMMSADGTIPEARLADTTSATEGQVLTLDANGNAKWEDASSGGSYHPDLFDWKWADHQLNDVQWLRADTFSWQSGSVYESAYQHLVDDLGITQTTYYAWYDSGDNVRYYTLSETPSANDALYQEVSGSMVEVSSESVVLSSYDSSTTPPRIRVWTLGGTESYYRDASNDITISRAQTETIAGVTITYYPSDDGHKIVLADQETNVIAIYNTTGVAWYYIVDTTNERFKLPRTKFGVTGIRNGVGNYVEAGLPDLSGSVNVGMYGNPSGTGVFTGASAGYNWPLRGTFTQGYGGNVPFNASNGNSIYGNSDTVQPKATEMYLYFYVGEFTQTAIENTAGVVTEDFNELNAHKVIAFQAPTAQNNYTWYRKYADGWVEQGGQFATVDTSYHTESITLSVAMSDANYSCFISCASTGSAYVPLIQNKTTTGFVAYNVVNATAYAAGWQVSGMSAS